MALAEYTQYASMSFTMPDICIRIRNILDDHRSDAQDIGRLIGVDPSLSAKILRLANSALFRFPSQIESISKAVNVIGGEALYNLVIAETASIAFKHFDTSLIAIDRHWHNSLYCGMTAKYIAKHLGIRGSDRFFVMGILKNLSELVVAKRSPELYRAYKEDLTTGLPWDKQLQHFGFTFAELSGTIMEDWKLPLPLFYPVQHVYQRLKVASDLDIAILHCAARLTLRESDKQHYAELDVITPDMAKLMAVDNEMLDNAALFAQKETNKVAMLIL